MASTHVFEVVIGGMVVEGELGFGQNGHIKFETALDATSREFACLTRLFSTLSSIYTQTGGHLTKIDIQEKPPGD